MALSIKNPKTEKLARELSAQTGDLIQSLLDGLRALPDLDDRSADEILGYDEHGLP